MLVRTIFVAVLVTTGLAMVCVPSPDDYVPQSWWADNALAPDFGIQGPAEDTLQQCKLTYLDCLRYYAIISTVTFLEWKPTCARY